MKDIYEGLLRQHGCIARQLSNKKQDFEICGVYSGLAFITSAREVMLRLHLKFICMFLFVNGHPAHYAETTEPVFIKHVGSGEV